MAAGARCALPCRISLVAVCAARFFATQANSGGRNGPSFSSRIRKLLPVYTRCSQDAARSPALLRLSTPPNDHTPLSRTLASVTTHGHAPHTQTRMSKGSARPPLSSTSCDCDAPAAELPATVPPHGSVPPISRRCTPAQPSRGAHAPHARAHRPPRPVHPPRGGLCHVLVDGGLRARAECRCGSARETFDPPSHLLVSKSKVGDGMGRGSQRGGWAERCQLCTPLPPRRASTAKAQTLMQPKRSIVRMSIALAKRPGGGVWEGGRVGGTQHRA